MKIEIGRDFPQYFRPSYPEEFELFSHLETTAAIPSPLFAITTWKDNGLPNVCFHAWGSFHGDRTAFFAVMGNLFQHTHTYANLRREGCFCLNFLPMSCYDRLVDTIHHNGDETDECAAGGFTAAPAKTVHAPVIQEAFLTLECTLKEVRDLSGAGPAHLRGGGLRPGIRKALRRGWLYAAGARTPESGDRGAGPVRHRHGGHPAAGLSSPLTPFSGQKNGARRLERQGAPRMQRDFFYSEPSSAGPAHHRWSSSAWRRSSARKSGWATAIRLSTRWRTERPLMGAMPNSVMT